MIRVWRQHSPPPSGAGIRCEGERGGRTRCACYFLFFFLKSNFAAFRSDLALVVIRLGVGHPFRPDLASVSPVLVFQVGPPFNLGSDPRPLALYTAIHTRGHTLPLQPMSLSPVSVQRSLLAHFDHPRQLESQIYTVRRVKRLLVRRFGSRSFDATRIGHSSPHSDKLSRDRFRAPSG